MCSAIKTCNYKKCDCVVVILLYRINVVAFANILGNITKFKEKYKAILFLSYPHAYEDKKMFN